MGGNRRIVIQKLAIKGCRCLKCHKPSVAGFGMAPTIPVKHKRAIPSKLVHAGVDEAGRGPLAGPVVAGACIIPSHVRIPGIDDSKKLTAAKREAIYTRLMEHPEVACDTYVPSPCANCI